MTVRATNARGRMTSAVNDGYTWHFSYDIMGRVQKQTLQTGNHCWNGSKFVLYHVHSVRTHSSYSLFSVGE